MLDQIQGALNAIRWKMLIIFVVFSVIPMILVGCFAVAALNVVIRRESAYLVEERIKVAVDQRKEIIDSVKGSDNFTSVIADQGELEIRSFHRLESDRSSVVVNGRVALDDQFLKQLANAAGLQVVDTRPTLLGPYRAKGGILGEVEANFIPGSRRPVPIVVTAQNWQTGQLEDWVVGQVRPSYSRTVDDLSHMGLRTASWVAPFGTIALGLVSVYSLGLFFSLRLARRIVNVIDALSDAALRVGKGDFSVRVTDPKQDQLGTLAASFNAMTHELENLQKHERQRVILERDIALGREAQQYLYPRRAPVLSRASVWGVTQPARNVSGDLYDFLSFTDSELGLICADVSGKGTSAALMMANLQAVAHGRLLLLDESNVRPGPAAFVAALNRDISGRFGENRYATLFYGEFNSETQILRYVNAGHTPPIFISAEGEVTRLSAGDLPVGMFPDATFQERQVTVAAGCSIVTYTDGVSEALNSEGEEFGEERILHCLTSLPTPVDAEGICKRLAEKVAEWGGADRFDDTTILALTVDAYL